MINSKMPDFSKSGILFFQRIIPYSCNRFFRPVSYTHLIFGRGIKFKNHSCASTSWFLTFAPGIIYFTPLLTLGQPFSMFHVKHVCGSEYSEPHSQNRFCEAFLLPMYGFSPYICLKICSIMQAYIAYL